MLNPEDKGILMKSFIFWTADFHQNSSYKYLLFWKKNAYFEVIIL